MSIGKIEFVLRRKNGTASKEPHA
ncbi:unnamed protein product, partial [Adineta steineri]